MIGMAILNIAHGAYTRVLLMFSVVLMYMAQVFHGTSGDVTVQSSGSGAPKDASGARSAQALSTLRVPTEPAQTRAHSTPMHPPALSSRREIGRASCRERV